MKFFFFKIGADELASTLGGKLESKRILWKSWLVSSDDKGSVRGEILMRWLGESRCDNKIQVQHLNFLGITEILGRGELIKNLGFL